MEHCIKYHRPLFFLMDIGEQLGYVIGKIRTIRREKRVSQMELSLRSNLSQSFIANVESGKKQPSVSTLLRIADALDVNPQDFFPELLDRNDQINDGKERVKERIRKLLEIL